jgi:hypothetical protein
VGAHDTRRDDVWTPGIRAARRLLAPAGNHRKHAIPCTATLNTAALRRYPEICAAIVERKWDLLGHGMYNTRFICGHSEAEERAHYQQMLRDVVS